MPGVDLSSLPSVDRLLAEPRILSLLTTHSREAVLDIVRQALQQARNEAIEGQVPVRPVGQIVDSVVARAGEHSRAWPQRVINATGVILHTNLGRAPMSDAAISAASGAAQGYSNLEYDLESGQRGSRNERISRVIAEATGAAAGLVVNNNASAVLLALAALGGAGGEVIVSRGEAVEIGGGFRIPDVLRQSGATLVEVGTTNKTYVADYESAITERTVAVLRVHPSNFTVSGFTHIPDLRELVEACSRRSIPVLNDLGSGSLMDTSRYGLTREPMVQESVATGAALTMFSGDKLLGGPQAGIVAGSREVVQRLGKHPLARALRSDKVTLAALAATLGSYIRGMAETEIPVWRMIAQSDAELRSRAETWRTDVGAGKVIEARSPIGGGSLPGQSLPTYVLSIAPPSGASALAASLRRHDPPVVARIDDDRVLLDPRTVHPEEDRVVVAALGASMS